MRFLLNENIPGTVIQALRNHGHDVVSAKETMAGNPDRLILVGLPLDVSHNQKGKRCKGSQ